MKKLGYVVVTIIIVILCTIWNGFALATVWNWLIPEVFGFGSLTPFEAIVIYGFITFGTRTRTISNADLKSYSDQLLEAVSIGITYPLMFIATGWILTWFM